MIVLSGGEIRALAPIYAYANTPSYLYRHFRSHPTVDLLTSRFSPEDLVATVNEIDGITHRDLREVVTAYACLVALTRHGRDEGRTCSRRVPPAALAMGTPDSCSLASDNTNDIHFTHCDTRSAGKTAPTDTVKFVDPDCRSRRSSVITCTLALCAEMVVRDTETNNISAISIVEEIKAHAFPISIRRLAALFYLERDSHDPQVPDCALRITQDAHGEMTFPVAVDFGAKLRNRAIVLLEGVQAHAPGQMKWSLVVNGTEVGSWKVLVVQAEVQAPVQIVAHTA